ncbi:MAG: DUF91 domain-containing protein [Stigonema ocellatum SAG 48.90 = DSM 106950]|nr:DUF91 domain-containing protein [Stigonema ocellatum SAG 48.90 = DSM 106950]
MQLEFCDILALDENKQLVIIELKNDEDRYIIQQLTRYYDNLVDERPFAQQIKYNEPVRLIAIAPSLSLSPECDKGTIYKIARILNKRWHSPKLRFDVE